MQTDSIAKFVRHHFRHFNAAALVDAADGYSRHLDAGGKMLVTLAGAMSTAELGLSLPGGDVIYNVSSSRAANLLKCWPTCRVGGIAGWYRSNVIYK